LVLLPDEHAWDRIQDIRLSHDRKVGVWPPHITLLRPFVRVQDFKAAADVLDQAVAFFLTCADMCGRILTFPDVC